MRRNVYIPGDSWEKLERLAKSEGRSISNLICRLADLYTQPTSHDLPGKTPSGVVGEASDGKRLLNVGRENEVNVAKVDLDVAELVEKDEAAGKERAVSNLKKDLESIMGGGVRSYSKEQQLKKGRKK